MDYGVGEALGGHVGGREGDEKTEYKSLKENETKWFRGIFIRSY